MTPRLRSRILGGVALAAAALAATSVYLQSDTSSAPTILFVHLPAAATTFLACAAAFVAGVGHLINGRRVWDDLAQAAGVVALASCTLLLVTGMLWGKQVWDQWWTWSPSLTFSLILWVLYAGFLGLRPMLSEARRPQVSSVYAIVAFLDVPLVYVSVKVLPDVHPSSIQLDGAAERALLLCVIAGVLAGAAFIAARLAGRQSSTDSGSRTAHSKPGIEAIPGPKPIIRNVVPR